MDPVDRLRAEIVAIEILMVEADDESRQDELRLMRRDKVEQLSYLLRLRTDRRLIDKKEVL